MDKYLEIIGKNLLVEENSEILVNFYGEEDNREQFLDFLKVLKTKNYQVKGVFFSKNKVIDECNQKKFTVDSVYQEYSFRETKTIIDIGTYLPTMLVEEVSSEGREYFISFMQEIWKAFAMKDKTFLQIQIPSKYNVKNSGMEFEDYTNLWKCLIDVNYKGIKELGNKMIEEYKGQTEYVLETGVSESLKFSTMDRDWYYDFGNGDFPAGEVYIAPIESSVNGTYEASKFYWEGQLLEKVVFTFEKGILTNCSNETILSDLKEAPGDSLSFAEVGIGLNDGIDKLSGYSAFDEKIKGTCHIAIGMNQMFGGTNNSPIHIDFVAESYELKINKTLEAVEKEFATYLEEIKIEKETKLEELKQKIVDDEIKHVKIELNVIDIFTKMFVLSVKKAKQADDKIQCLKKSYLDFFEIIPRNWYINLEKCKEHAATEEAFIEELKIKQMLTIKNQFSERV